MCPHTRKYFRPFPFRERRRRSRCDPLCCIFAMPFSCFPFCFFLRPRENEGRGHCVEKVPSLPPPLLPPRPCSRFTRPTTTTTTSSSSFFLLLLFSSSFRLEPQILFLSLPCSLRQNDGSETTLFAEMALNFSSLRYSFLECTEIAEHRHNEIPSCIYC